MIRLAPLALVVAAGAVGGCKVKDPPPITAPWSDDFERDSLGGDYYPSGGEYTIENGVLVARKGYNHPLWLRKALPRDVRIELDVWAGTNVGDVKVELFGDGHSHAHNKGAYTSSGYVAIFGGWSNSKSILAKQNEHGTEMSVDPTKVKVIPDRKYHWVLERRGDTLTWTMDGKPFLTYQDPSPLEGKGHAYFAFANWESETRFDNLVITPL